MANPTSTHPGQQVDVRGPRFAAWVTTGVLVLVLLLRPSPLSRRPAAHRAGVVFAIGAVAGPRRSPYGQLFAAFVAPRLSPTVEREPVATAVRAGLGLTFAPSGGGLLLGAGIVGGIATGFALFAALLNAAFGICLGCQIYPLVARLRGGTPSAA
ncbi:DUF4395 family protein [Rhodococcus hoagii]|nr:DUF4395 family protein [Prescottella equi]